MGEPFKDAKVDQLYWQLMGFRSSSKLELNFWLLTIATGCYSNLFHLKTSSYNEFWLVVLLGRVVLLLLLGCWLFHALLVIWLVAIS